MLTMGSAVILVYSIAPVGVQPVLDKQRIAGHSKAESEIYQSCKSKPGKQGGWRCPCRIAKGGPKLSEQVEQGDDRNQGSVLEQSDEDIDDVRQRHPQRLRQDDQRRHPPVGQAERLRRLVLAARNGHEPAAHGYTWEPIYAKSRAEQKASFEQNIKAIQKATGQRPYGFNAAGMRAAPDTFEILQELGFLYHTDDLSRDEPFLIPVAGKPFVVVPYTFMLNDLQGYENRWRTAADMAGELKSEFDALYEESAHKRRMISVSAHDRVAGRAGRMRVIEDFIVYAQRHPGVAFLRKDEIAKFALASPLTIREG